MSSGFKIIRQGPHKHDKNVHFVPKNRIYSFYDDEGDGSVFRAKQKSAPIRCPLCGSESNMHAPTIIRDSGQWQCTVCGHRW